MLGPFPSPISSFHSILSLFISQLFLFIKFSTYPFFPPQYSLFTFINTCYLSISYLSRSLRSFVFHRSVIFVLFNFYFSFFPSIFSFHLHSYLPNSPFPFLPLKIFFRFLSLSNPAHFLFSSHFLHVSVFFIVHFLLFFVVVFLVLCFLSVASLPRALYVSSFGFFTSLLTFFSSPSSFSRHLSPPSLLEPLSFTVFMINPIFNSSFLSLSFSAIFFPSFPDLSLRFSSFLHHLHLFFAFLIFLPSLYHLHLLLTLSSPSFPSPPPRTCSSLPFTSLPPSHLLISFI